MGAIRYSSSMARACCSGGRTPRLLGFVNDYQDIVACRHLLLHRQLTHAIPASAGGVPQVVKTDDCHVAANYGWIVDRLQASSPPPAQSRVWAVVTELGHPSSEGHWPTITPAQVRAAVWQSLISQGREGSTTSITTSAGRTRFEHILRDGAKAASAYATIRCDGEGHQQTDQRAGLGPQLPDGPLRLVPGAWHDRDGEVGERQEGEGCGPKKKHMKMKRRELQKDEEAAVRVRRLGGIVRAGEVFVTVRQAKPKLRSSERAATFRFARGHSATASPTGTRSTSTASTVGSRCGPRKGKVSHVGLPGGGDPPTSSSTDFWVIIAAVVLSLAGMLAFFRVGRVRSGSCRGPEADEANPPSHDRVTEPPGRRARAYRSLCA